MTVVLDAREEPGKRCGSAQLFTAPAVRPETMYFRKA
jgi:hypothetical protein